MDRSLTRAIRAALTTTGIVALASAALVAPVSAARPAGSIAGMTMSVSLPACGANGQGGPEGAELTLELRREGRLIRSKAFTVFPGGYWDANWSCRSFDATQVIRAGDRLVIVGDGERRGLTVPDLFPAADPTTDRVVGTTKGGSLTIQPYACFVPGGWCNSSVPPQPLDLQPAGGWSIDLTTLSPIAPGDMLGMEWSSDAGDIVRLTAFAPSFEATLGRSRVRGFGIPGRVVKVVLRDADGTYLASGGRRIKTPTGTWEISLLRDGVPVTVQPGQRLTSTVYPGARLRVIPTSFSVTKATGALEGHCYADTWALIYVRASNTGGAFVRQTDAEGNVADTFTDLGLPIPDGARARLSCRSESGNLLTTRARAS